MKTYEPCLCGAPDCSRCFPATWEDSIITDHYIDELKSGQTNLPFDEWLAEREMIKIEYMIDAYENR